ncbi:DUF3800 domain-containing protein [Clostridium sp.]|uniref:DUF3800 domain-containing protein n=1 Tax=Clostridium sp. TaxID=1506 RepID=UPI00399464ED
MKKLVIYCDESIKKGKFYSNFYGGALVDEKNINFIVNELENLKSKIELNGELKWTNVSSQVLDKYIEFINKYFDFINSDIIKIRLMFKQEYHKTCGLTSEQKEQEFYILYYHFLKQAFGLKFCNKTDDFIKLRIYFDKLPNKKQKNIEFKRKIQHLQNLDMFKTANIIIDPSDITDVNSKKHVILQGMDIILGAMKFRLNEEHKIIPVGKKRRGKKTIAKEKLYKHIRSRIVEKYPHFNIGISTGYRGNEENVWNDSYRHWNFISTNSEIDPSKAKK